MNLRSRSILIIDGDQGNSGVLQESLSHTNSKFAVTLIQKGKEAIAHLQHIANSSSQTYPDLILLDLCLPDMSGSEMLQTIRNDIQMPRIPIIGYSGLEDETQIKACYALGINCCVKKPMNFEESNELAQAIDRFWFSTIQLPTDIEQS